MSWNFRVCKETKGNVVKYSIHEAYYNDGGEIWGVTDDETGVASFLNPEPEIGDLETEEDRLLEMKQTIDWMLEAFDKDIIDLDTVKFAEQSDEYSND